MCIGHLTFANSTDPNTQLHHFDRLMHRLGWANGAFGSRLHWLCRVGGTPDHLHLHFLIGKHKLTHSEKHSYTPEKVCEFINSEWKENFGIRDVEPFVPYINGVSYVLRHEDGNDALVVMSDALKQALKYLKRKADEPAPDRDPMAVELVGYLRRYGGSVGFGDQMKEVRWET